MRVGVHGATGRMGRLVLAELDGARDLVLHAAITRSGSAHEGLDAGTLAGGSPCGIRVSSDVSALSECDVVIDFSHPTVAARLFRELPPGPLVTGTTGLDAQAVHALNERARHSPTLHATNFSIGIAVMRQAVRWLASSLPDWDAELVEVHHRHKVDAPSGTATTLLDELDAGRMHAAQRTHGRRGLTGVRPAGDVGIHALRLGNVIGQHTLSLGGPGETLCIHHTAEDRRVFAVGAVEAARWVADKAPGRYDMVEMLGLSALPTRKPPT